MVVEKMEEYALASAEAAYKNPGEQAPMGFMALGGEIQGSENAPPPYGPETVMSPLPDWHRKYQVGDCGRMYEHG